VDALSGWGNFYVIVGSSAGALIGLQFVVITLIAARMTAGTDWQASGAFMTPSVVHFGVVLFLSAAVSAPWNEITPVALLWGLTGICGVVYIILVARRMWAQQVYRPVFEDWLFHAALPCVAYVTLAASAFAVCLHFLPASFLVGGAVLVLLFAGIHNAWDAVTYHVFVKSRQEKVGPDAGPGPEDSERTP
jgi:hypothetical protein